MPSQSAISPDRALGSVPWQSLSKRPIFRTISSRAVMRLALWRRERLDEEALQRRLPATECLDQCHAEDGSSKTVDPYK
jgi:hypothetical protein